MPAKARPTSLSQISAATFCFVALALLAHLSLLTLPYFWDEAGYYIPAARDFFLSGSVIPHSTLHTAHTPLLSIYLAAIWHVFGFKIVATRVAMLLVAAFGYWQVFRLAQAVSNRTVAMAATILTAVYPIVFAQSSLAHADLLATAFLWWGVRAYFDPAAKRWELPLAFTLAVLAKEISIVVPLALTAFEVLRARRQALPKVLALCAAPSIALVIWFSWFRLETGHWFGDPEYYRYNVGATITPLRILLAFVQRLWQTFGHMNMWLATLITVVAMFLPPKERRDRIAIPTQLAFAAIILATLLFHSIVGGALLTRYLLPIYPLILIVFVSTWWRRLPHWGWVAATVGIVFAVGLFVNPPYRFAPEDNLNYADFVRLHQQAAKQIESRFPTARVLTAWPASDELTKPELGYVTRPHPVIAARDFSAEEMLVARDAPFDVALVFSTKYEPAHPRFQSRWWTAMSERFFDYHHDLAPEPISALLSGRIVWQTERNRQWIAVIVRELPENARLSSTIDHPI